ncbi:MAG: 5-(carboxyamino)imidazole ribonucleotide mutase [bacterium]|nr:5-(carboxyamino)imidazole ribonucleotide mutase [bacterium]
MNEIKRVPLVWIVMGSVSDAEKMKAAEETLHDLTIPSEVDALSAHRTPDDVAQLAKSARDRGIKVIIAAAGGAAHLPGVIAANTILPVIGVPISGKEGLGGLDALLSIVQMPAGVSVATMPINGAKNAALFAAQILTTSSQYAHFETHLVKYKEKMAADVRLRNKSLHELGIVEYLKLTSPTHKA